MPLNICLNPPTHSPLAAVLIRRVYLVGTGMDNKRAQLLAFPIDRRVALVRRAAAELLELNGDDANGYWRTKAKTLLQELMRQGRDMDDARKEVLRFFEAVQVEFRRELAQQRETIRA
jgi:hypothetical protein